MKVYEENTGTAPLTGYKWVVSLKSQPLYRQENNIK